MKIYKHRIFAKWARHEGIVHAALKQAINEIELGLVEANLGSGLYKKRIARKGVGKRGGFRTFIAFKQGDAAIFVYGFGKNHCENLSVKELLALKALAKDYLSVPKSVIRRAVAKGDLVEVK